MPRENDLLDSHGVAVDHGTSGRGRARRARLAGLALTSLLASFAQRSSAAEEGFALNRFEPAERDSAWFALESLDLRGHGRWSTGVVGDWAHRPLVIYDSAGNELQALLRDQLYAYVGGSVVFWDRLRLSVSFPLVLVSTSGASNPGAPTLDVASGTSVGDLRLGADVRVFGEYGDVVIVALGAHVYAPTGSSTAMTGDGKLRVQPHAFAAGRVGAFEYAVRTGLNVRSRSDFAGQSLGSEWMFGAAGGVRFLDSQLLVGPELWGGTAVSSSLGVFDKEGTPVEALLGAHYRVREFNFGVGAGPGLSRGFGTPSMRALASLQWIQDVSEPPPAPPPLDRDGDGITDASDGCPAEAGPAHADPRKHGCPEPQDSDGDNILDPEDACPAVRGEATPIPATNGCPPPDGDGDGVLDREDACVSEAGLRDVDPAKNGCPPPKDRDGDRIMDPEDACPEQVGEADSDPTKNGCPRVSLKGDVVQVLDRIEFENGKATLAPNSEPILAAVARLLEEHPEILALDIEGHTDSRGKHASNMDLSKRRAATVRSWLIAHGIAAKRLTSHGIGPDRPLDSNDTDGGRQKNRRVEFHVLDAAESVPSSTGGSKEQGR
jgi:OmpA-OmpF porin, OOP family